MTARILTALLILATTAVGNYTLEPTAIDYGGGQGESINYSLVSATTPGEHTSSASYIARTGFAGQLGSPTGIALSAPVPGIAEAGTHQLSAEQLYDDGTRSPLPAGSITWSVLSGPISGISSLGLATTAAIYQDTSATVLGTSGPFSGGLTLTILNTLPDNYGTYAADELPDSWQIQYFGFDAPNASKYDDFDGDQIGNLLEFANGTDPSSTSSGHQNLSYTGNDITPGSPLLEYAPDPNSFDYRVLFIRRKDYPTAGLIYTPQFSRNLTQWSDATNPIVVLADDGTHEVVSHRFPVLIDGQPTSSRFFSLRISIAPD